MKRSLEHLEGLVVGGKYLLESLVGEGGMAYVYRGVHKDFNHPIAFKVLFSHLAKKDEVRERFKREARLQFRLQHPNIVRVIDMIEEEGLLGIVLDWVEGRDLEDYLKELNRPVSLLELRRIFVPILTAVGYAHDENIVHRDLKPSNVLLEGKPGQEIPKVMDFGIAKSLGDDNFKTRTGMMVGTPYYISPEQAQGMKSVDHRTDIYSLGVTLFQLLTGKVPYQGTNALEVVAQHCFHEVPNPLAFRQDIPPQFEAVVQKAMAKDPVDRFRTARAFARELLPLLPNLGNLEVSQDELEAVSSPKTSPHITALGEPPVPQGWQSPGVTVATPVPPTQAPPVDKTQLSWEYNSAEHNQISGASFGGIPVATQQPLPSGEVWHPEQVHGHSGSYPSETPSSVTPPYARPLPLEQHSLEVPLAPQLYSYPPVSVDVEATQDDLQAGLRQQDKWFRSAPVLWSIVAVLIVVLSGGVYAMVQSIRAKQNKAQVSKKNSTGKSVERRSSQPEPRPPVRIVIVDTTKDAGASDSKVQPNPSRLSNAGVKPRQVRIVQVLPRKRKVVRRRRRRVVRRRHIRRKVQRRRRLPAARMGSWKACRLCVSQRFRVMRNRNTIGMMADSASGCNVNDFQAIGRTCASSCGSRYLWFCKASMRASGGACKDWVKERSFMGRYRSSMSAKVIKACLSSYDR